MQAGSPASALPGLNSVSGSIPALGSVTGTLSGVTGSLQNGSLNGGSVGTPLSGLSG
jgi:hypothetical protein